MLNIASQAETLFDLLQERGERFATLPAIFQASDRPVTYGELFAHARQLRRFFDDLGASPTDRVAVVLTRCADFATAIFGLSSRAVVVALSEHLPESEYAQIFAELEIAGIIVAADGGLTARRVALRQGRSIVEIATPANASDGSMVVTSEGWRSLRPQSDTPRDTVMLMRSSGTTGKPKVVPISFSHAIAFGESNQSILRLHAEDRGLIVQPLHLAGGYSQMLASIIATSSVGHLEATDIRAIATEIGSGNITWFGSMAATHRELLTYFAQHPAMLAGSRLRFVRAGGTAIDPVLAQNIETTYNAPLIAGYGSTEAGLIASNELDTSLNRSGSVGRPIFCELEIVDDQGIVLPPESLGEIVVRGRGVFTSYLHENDNVESFFEDWFRTGDLGFLDNDGYVYVKGRKRDFINRGGEKISPLDVVDALMRHPQITESLAFPIAHPTLGEEVAAAVVLTPGPQPSEHDLRAYCLEHLTLAKTPKRFFFVDQFPRSLSGKVDISALKESLSAVKSTEIPSGEAKDTLATEELIAIYQDLLEIAPIAADDDFFLQGGDSLRMARLITEIEHRWGIHLNPVDIFRAGTPRLIAAQMYHTPNADEDELPCVQVGSKQTPYFFFHGDLHGVGKYVFDFARAFDADRSVYALPPHGTAGLPALASIEEMADDYIRKIRRQFPSGPYLLGGYCNGGIVAFEAARRLRAQGFEVGPLLLVSASPINGYFHTLRSVIDWSGKILRLDPVTQQQYYATFRTSMLDWREKLARKMHSINVRYGLAADRENRDHHAPQSAQWRALYAWIGSVLSGYFAPRYDGSAHVIWAQGDDTRAYFPPDRCYGWTGIIRSVSVEMVSGTHLSVVWQGYERIAQSAQRLYDSYP